MRQSVRNADAAGKLIRVPTGDGMALVFYTSPDAPVRCAIELSKADQADPKLELRMGIHSGPVDQISDVNERTNVAGAGINMAQRVMDCGDAGHILLSRRIADDLGQVGHVSFIDISLLKSTHQSAERVTALSERSRVQANGGSREEAD